MSDNRLFVYGTLKPGQSRWPYLKPYVDPLESPALAEVEGRLWATPWGWPAFTEGTTPIRGVLVTLHSDLVEEALTRLDQIEGVDTGLFVRAPAQTSKDIACSIYLWPSSIDDFVLLDGEW